MAKTRIGLAAAGADQLPRGGLRDCQPEFKRTCWTTSSRACVACWEASSLTPFKSLRFCACTGGGGRQSWNGQWSPVFLEAFLKIPVDLSHDSLTFVLHPKSNLGAEEPQVIDQPGLIPAVDVEPICRIGPGGGVALSCTGLAAAGADQLPCGGLRTGRCGTCGRGNKRGELDLLNNCYAEDPMSCTVAASKKISFMAMNLP